MVRDNEFAPGTTEAVLHESGIARQLRLVTVIKQTATQLVIAGSNGGTRRFRASDGYEIGSVGYGRAYLSPATDSARDDARRSIALRELEMTVFRIDQFIRSEEMRKMNRSADELELSLASVQAALKVLKS